MQVEINYWAVLLAALIVFGFSAVWYTPLVMGKRWQRAASITKPYPKNKLGLVYLLFGTAVLGGTYIFAHFVYIAHAFFDNSYLQDSLITALWIWVGFVVTRVVTHNVFEQKPRSLTYITILYELVCILIVATVIGVAGN